DPNVPVCGLIGGVRPYRGHEMAVAAIKRMGGQAQLLIAGNPIDDEYRRNVEAIAAGYPHIVCRMGTLTDTEYAEMVQACDVILLPYQGITGSAALLAAWT